MPAQIAADGFALRKFFDKSGLQIKRFVFCPAQRDDRNKSRRLGRRQICLIVCVRLAGRGINAGLIGRNPVDAEF